MIHTIYMKIAGINIAVDCMYPISVRNLPETYETFINGSGPSSADMRITIEAGPMPDTSLMTRIFDTGQSWTMCKHNDVCFLTLSLAASDNQPVWIAAFNADCAKIKLYCSDLLISAENGDRVLSAPLGYPLDQLLMMHLLAGRSGVLVHSAGFGVNGRGCIFPGRSGAGKSTISRIFSGRDGIEALSDDRIIIRKIDGRFIAFGTPWAGDAGIAENRGIGLESIFFIHHSEKNIIRDLSPAEAVRRLMPVSSIPWYDEDAVSNILAFCEDLVYAVPAYELRFWPDQEIAAMLEDFIAGRMRS